MIIRRATGDDLAATLALRDDARAWLASIGSDQWQDAWPTHDAMVSRILASINDRTTWMVDADDGTTIATLALDDFADPKLWTPTERHEPARYLHRLILARSHAGHGLGATLIDWASDRANREGARWLRIDVWTTNEPLQRYYLAHGFQRVRTLHLPDYPSGALLQRPAERIPTPGIREVDTTTYAPQKP